MPITFPSPPRRILILKPSAIGDVVHTLPVLNLLRKTYPQTHIAWLVTPACAGLLEGHPQLDEVIRFDRKGYGQGYAPWSRFETEDRQLTDGEVLPPSPGTPGEGGGEGALM